jgi:hypothetical protein
MANSRVGGIIQLKIGGTIYNAKGAFTYNIGAPKREAVVGSDAVHGFKELPQAPMIEGVITDTSDLDLSTLLNFRDGTVILSLANGKSVSLNNAFYAGDGNVTTEEGEIEVSFKGTSAKENKAS